MRHGDFTGLASSYSQFRPGYAETVVSMVLSLVDKPVGEIDFADVGAGTGIWTRMISRRGVRSSIAVEPNDEMRAKGKEDSRDHPIEWRDGRGEQNGLDSKSLDLLTMASSFHWVEFDQGILEFVRVVRSGGRFAVLWNPRCVEANPFTHKVERYLFENVPNLKRVSSGRSHFTENLTERLAAHPLLDDVAYMEGYHVAQQTPEQYLGVWRSVNDIRVQAGEEKFKAFLDFVRNELEAVSEVEAHYQTRAWSARVK